MTRIRIPLGESTRMWRNWSTDRQTVAIYRQGSAVVLMTGAHTTLFTDPALLRELARNLDRAADAIERGDV